MKRQRSLLSFVFFGEQSSSTQPPEKRPTVESKSEENPEQSESGSPTEPPPASAEQSRTPVTFRKLCPPYDLQEVHEIAQNLSDFER